MKNPWLVYVTVAVISALAGIAIAGPPNTVGTDATIIVPEVTTSTTTSTTTTSTPEPDPEPAPTTTEAEPAQTTTTEVAETTTTTEPEPEIDRATVEVVAVNGANIEGLATRVRDELRDLGFERASSADGAEIVDETVVYFVPGFEVEAVEVAEALDLELGDVKPVEDAPSFGLDDDDQVAVYLGRDNA